MTSKFFAAVLMALPLFVIASQTVDCENAATTLAINHCASIERNLAKNQLNQYLEASYKHNESDPELVEAIKRAQQDWQNYLSSHCGSVYKQWRHGTIGRSISINCETKLLKQRTHEIWENFLNYMDSSPPVLPEPKL